MPDRIATARQSGKESSLREKAVEAFFSSNRSVGFQEAIDAVIAVCMEEAAKVAEPHALQCECCRDTSLATAAALRSLIPTSEAE